MDGRPLKRSYSTMAQPPEDLAEDGSFDDDTTGSDGTLPSASAGTDPREDSSSDGGPSNGMDNSDATPDNSFAGFCDEKDLEYYNKDTHDITEEMLTHRPTPTPSSLLGLPTELLSKIVVRLDKKSMSALRLATKELTEAISREFRLLLHNQRVEFAPEGFNKLLNISQSRYAEEVKSIEFWAFNFNQTVA